MKTSKALVTLADICQSQWGMVTTAQARKHGLNNMTLNRLCASGHLIRVRHGVYRDSGAPEDEYESLKAEWLAADPNRFAHERLRDKSHTLVASGESACLLHRIGDLRASRDEFTTPKRRQTQRSDTRYRTRLLPATDITICEGLPVTTRERTIADLIEARHDLSLIAGVLRDASRQSNLDISRMIELLNPLAARNGFSDGKELFNNLLEIADLDAKSIARSMFALPVFRETILTEALRSFSQIEIPGSMLESLRAINATVTSSQVQQLKDLSKIFQEAMKPISTRNLEISTGLNAALLQISQSMTMAIKMSETAGALVGKEIRSGVNEATSTGRIDDQVRAKGVQ